MTTVEINFNKLEGIYHLLYKKHECAGTLKIKEGCVESFTTASGGADSVHTPLSELNWHTPPLFLYDRESVCWGWPSGEDMREVIFFSLGGNKAHLVFSVEGVYVLSVTECFKNWLKNLKEQEDRGLVIALLEMVFKSTHNLRTLEYNKLFPLNPRDWIKMVERIRIEYLLTTTTGPDVCGEITCQQITTHQSGDKDREKMSIKDYAENYEGKTLTVYRVGKNGSINGSKELTIEQAMENIELLSKSLDASCGKNSNSKIYNIRFFKNRGLKKEYFNDLTPDQREKIYKQLNKERTLQPPARKAKI